MAIDPKDPRPLTLNRPAASASASGGGGPNSESSRLFFSGGDSGGADEQLSAAAKVKLLCSFGGRIAPRPGDAALRYVGGQTRLISVPRAASYSDLMRKLAAVAAAGDGDDAAAAASGGVAVKYQLPGEDLDSLISVSCPEDMVNMMEEYEKLAAASPDGSAKLRVFLFSASSSSSAAAAVTDPLAAGYVDAINSGAESSGVIPRNESVASVGSSTYHAEGFAAASGADAVDGMSMRFPSPPTMSGFPDAQGISATSAPPMGVPAQNPNFVRPEPTQVAGYVPPPVSQAYIDTEQVQYINSQQLGGQTLPQSINLVPLQMNQYAPGIPVANPVPTTTQVGSTLKPIPARAEQIVENPYATRPLQQPPADQHYKVLQPLSQLPLPPMPPGYLHPSDAQMYSMQQPVSDALKYGMQQPVVTSMGGVPVVTSSASMPMVRYDDCAMCQKALPHAHSDSVFREHSNLSPGGNPETTAVFYSLHPENAPKQHNPHGGTGAPGNYTVESRVESMLPAAQFDARLAGQKPVVQVAQTPDAASVLVHPPVVARAPASSNGAFVRNLPQSHAEDPFRQQQLQQQWQSMQPLHYQVNRTGSNPPGVDAGAVKNVNYQPAAPELSHDYVRAVDAQMQAVHLGPVAPPEPNAQVTPAVSHLGAIGDGKIEKPVHIESASRYISQVGGHQMANAFVTPALISEENLAKTIEQVPPVTCDVVGAQNVHLNTMQQPSILGNHVPVSSNLGVGIEPAIPDERVLARPVYSNIQVPAYAGSTVYPIADKKDEAAQLHPGEMLSHLVAAYPSGNGQFEPKSTGGVTVPVETMQEPVYSESLFSNQDPWKAVENANLPPPRHTKFANKEPVTKDPVIAKDPFMESHLPTSNVSNFVVLLEEGNLPHCPDSLSKEAIAEPVQVTKGSGEEIIKQQLQAVAEGVAASVLQSSSSSKASGIPEKNIDSERADVRNSQANPGVPILDDIDNLQIIKNSDLEELRELGSGTFGTVYHGKWRGTDVAIKRINDRCFAGKASEQERLRTDFWNEACKLASLHHPNVVAFYGVVLDGPGGSVATVTEYMTNGSLRQALQRNDKIFDRRRRLIIAMDVAFGMEYLHGKNIVHFDLKSDNLLVNLRDPQRPICKVGDLGLSKVKCQTLISGGVRGTLPWMAPELLNGSSSLVSEKVDVFSFGIVMWELLTGEEPYTNLHYGAIIGGIVNNTLRPPVPESCAPEWRSLMEDCWSSEPSERPSFTEVVRRLRAMAASPHKGQAQQAQKQNI